MFSSSESTATPPPGRFAYEHDGKNYQLYGFNPSSLLMFYQARSQKMSCWAAALSNAIMTAQSNAFVEEQTILKHFKWDGKSYGPQPSQYQEIIDVTMRDLAGMKGCKCAVVDKLGKQDPVNFMAHLRPLAEGKPVIVGVLDHSHVVNLLAFGICVETAKAVVAIYDPDPEVGFQIGDLGQYLGGYKPTEAFVLPAS